MEKTIASLVAQTDRSFSVLISDNHSKEGIDKITKAAAKLAEAGICVKCVKPPVELGRVEHWNWAHYSADADWVKPLFAGDWLDAHFIAKLRNVMKENPACLYVYAGYVYHKRGEPDKTFINRWAGKFQSADELSQVVIKYGMQFGPPSAAAYDRIAFVGAGGYPTHLPICSDSLLFCTLAARHGAFGIPEGLCHFNIHGARFSTTLPKKRLDTFRECLAYYFMLAYFLWTESVPYSRWDFTKLLIRETRGYMGD